MPCASVSGEMTPEAERSLNSAGHQGKVGRWSTALPAVVGPAALLSAEREKLSAGRSGRGQEGETGCMGCPHGSVPPSGAPCTAHTGLDTHGLPSEAQEGKVQKASTLVL